VATDVYERLAQHLDTLPAGFQRTASGVELRILRRLFTDEDAELALHLSLIPEEPRVIARRARIPVEEAARRLQALEEKRLIGGVAREGKPPLYMASQFIVGFWEGQVDRLDPQLVHDFEEYFPSAVNPEHWRKSPQLRTVPVARSISTQTRVMPYERAEELVRAHSIFAVSNCICRQEARMLGKGCDKPLESCLSFGMAAEQVTRTGRGRAIDLSQVLDVLVKAEEAGLVLQPANARNALFLCTCCGCCCGVLRTMKRQPKPASYVASAFVAVQNAETCQGCGACETRCQMEAIHLAEGTAVLDHDRCIGCGLCVETCPTGSLSLARKPDGEQPVVPKDIIDNYIQMGKARGRYGIGELIGMQIRSKVDRLLSPR
jgi:Na+-translocating ferredoxin:NAD+ oxidoreductase subunit B